MIHSLIDTTYCPGWRIVQKVRHLSIIASWPCSHFESGLVRLHNWTETNRRLFCRRSAWFEMTERVSLPGLLVPSMNIQLAFSSALVTNHGSVLTKLIVWFKFKDRSAAMINEASRTTLIMQVIYIYISRIITTEKRWVVWMVGREGLQFITNITHGLPGWHLIKEDLETEETCVREVCDRKLKVAGRKTDCKWRDERHPFSQMTVS